MSNLTETKEGEWLAICPRFKPLNYYKILYELFEENIKLRKLLKDSRKKLHDCCPVLYGNLINQIDEVIK